MHIYAEYFRGFKHIDIDLEKFNFLVGDNSSGKSSILYLIESISRNDLNSTPKMDEDFGVSEYDYFSPYFGYKDVDFAFYEDESNFYAKIVTVRRHTNLPPQVLSCTYIYDGLALSYRKRGGGQQKRIQFGLRPDSIADCMKIHRENRGYKKAKEIEGLSISNPSMIFVHHAKQMENLEDFASKVLNTKVSNCRLISPIRALPEKFYKYRRKISAHGSHFASMWMDVFEFSNSDQFSYINLFGKEAGLFDRVSVKKISNKIQDSPLVVTVHRNGKDFALNQVGVGVSQIVPVLIESAYSQSMASHVLLIQQPELHLHPVAQAALGSYFFTSAKNGLKAVIETHSSYFIDRFRSEIRDNIKGDIIDAAPDSVRIIFCTNSDAGNAVQIIGVDAEGRFVNDPDEYHNFFIQETLRTMF